MSKATERLAQRVDDLFDYAHANPGGFTIEDVMNDFEWTHGVAKGTVRDLRLFLGDFDDVNLPCSPNGSFERWTYKLTGDHADSASWVETRVTDTKSRLRTMHAVTTSMVAASDGRSAAGKEAIVMERAIRHLLENLT